MPHDGYLARFLAEWRMRGTTLRRWLNGTLMVLGGAAILVASNWLADRMFPD